MCYRISVRIGQVILFLIKYGKHNLLGFTLNIPFFFPCIIANGGVEADVRHRVNEGCKVLGALKGVMKNRGLGMNVKKVLDEKVDVLIIVCGSESWCMKVTERQKLNLLEMKCLKSMTGVSQLDRVRNEVVRVRTGVRRELAARVDTNVLRWFSHLERMDNE